MITAVAITAGITDHGGTTAMETTRLRGGGAVMMTMMTVHLHGGAATMTTIRLHGGAAMTTMIRGAMTAAGTMTGEMTGVIGIPAELTGTVTGDPGSNKKRTAQAVLFHVLNGDYPSRASRRG